MAENENLVLYIDDEEVNLMLFEASFSGFYKVFLAKSTFEADKLIAIHKFKVIVSDINLPRESGLDFLKRLTFEEGYEPVLILLSAFINNDLLLRAINQGRIFRYLTKPWNYQEVKFTIDHAIQIYDLRNNNFLLNKQKEESRLNFLKIFQSSLDGIVLFNNDLIILQVNKAFHDDLGITRQELIGEKLTRFIPVESNNTFWESIYSLELNPHSYTEFDYFQNIEIKKTFEVVNSKIEIQGNMVTMSLFRDITERKQNEQKILNAIIHAEEKERSRLAKELHDGLGPIMATLKMYLEWLNDKGKLENHPDVLELSLNSINEAIVTLKNISNNLSPHILEKFGLVAALTAFIDRVKKVSPIDFNLSFHLINKFQLAIEMSLYRVLTECINNTIKHSGASEIRLEIWNNEKILYFIYSDNGAGFDPNIIENADSGMGLYNLKNRILTLGGKVSIQTQPGSGVRIESEIPIN